MNVSVLSQKIETMAHCLRYFSLVADWHPKLKGRDLFISHFVDVSFHSWQMLKEKQLMKTGQKVTKASKQRTRQLFCPLYCIQAMGTRAVLWFNNHIPLIPVITHPTLDSATSQKPHLWLYETLGGHLHLNHNN